MKSQLSLPKCIAQIVVDYIQFEYKKRHLKMFQRFNLDKFYKSLYLIIVKEKLPNGNIVKDKKVVKYLIERNEKMHYPYKLRFEDNTYMVIDIDELNTNYYLYNRIEKVKIIDIFTEKNLLDIINKLTNITLFYGCCATTGIVNEFIHNTNNNYASGKYIFIGERNLLFDKWYIRICIIHERASILYKEKKLGFAEDIVEEKFLKMID